MKVSVITLHAVFNYGSVLQTYATQQIFRQLGCEVEIIDYRRTPVQTKSIRLLLKDPENNFLGKLKLIMLLPSIVKGRNVIDGFLDKHISMTERLYRTDADFEEYPIEADIYCTGSDQVWNTGWHKEIPAPFFLNFVPDEKKKIAFSASIGKENLEDWEKPVIHDFLKRYSAISVREKSAVDIIHSLDDRIEVDLVLDPTLSVSPGTWYELAAPERIVKEKYILIYQLSKDSKMDRYAKELAKKKHLKLIRLCTRYDLLRKSGHGIVLPKVESFLSLIRDAEYIVTNSFHGTAFSLIFHKQFIDIYPGLYSSRLDNILNLTGLQDRKLTDYNDFSMIERPIDYQKVDKKIENERAHTLQFLSDAIYGKKV